MTSVLPTLVIGTNKTPPFAVTRHVNTNRPPGSAPSSCPSDSSSQHIESLCVTWGHVGRIRNNIPFPTLEDVGRAGLQLESTQPSIIAYLKDLSEQFGEYFGEESLVNQWVRNPFSFPVRPRDGLSLQEEEALVDLISKMDLKKKIMSEVSPVHLCLWSQSSHISPKKSVKVLIPFTSTYLCECGFFALTMIISKYHSSLQVEDDLRLLLSAVRPCISRLCA